MPIHSSSPKDDFQVGDQPISYFSNLEYLDFLARRMSKSVTNQTWQTNQVLTDCSPIGIKSSRKLLQTIHDTWWQDSEELSFWFLPFVMAEPYQWMEVEIFR